MAQQNYFSVMVVGDNPDELLKPYSKDLIVDDYIVYKADEAKKLQENEITVLSKLLELKTLSEKQESYIQDKLDLIKEFNPTEYFNFLTDGMKLDEDGNAISNINPNGKFDFAKKGRRFSLPLKLYDGSETWQAHSREIDFEGMHLTNYRTYEVVWEMFKEGREPKTEEEKTLYDNMKTMNNYFDSFKSKEDYVVYNTAFFHYAYLDGKQGWIDMDDVKDSHKWVAEFYDRFVMPLNPDDLVTIYECRLV